MRLLYLCGEYDNFQFLELEKSKFVEKSYIDFEPTEAGNGRDFLFNDIQRDFAKINKTPNGDYLITQFINIYQLNKLFPVYYVDKMPDMTNRLLQKRQAEFGFMEYLTIHKLKDWRYENEWRLIYDAGSFYFGPEDVLKDFWTHGKSISLCRVRRDVGQQ